VSRATVKNVGQAVNHSEGAFEKRPEAALSGRRFSSRQFFDAVRTHVQISQGTRLQTQPDLHGAVQTS
jgi:hypothetical protein